MAPFFLLPYFYQKDDPLKTCAANKKQKNKKQKQNKKQNKTKTKTNKQTNKQKNPKGFTHVSWHKFTSNFKNTSHVFRVTPGENLPDKTHHTLPNACSLYVEYCALLILRLTEKARMSVLTAWNPRLKFERQFCALYFST